MSRQEEQIWNEEELREEQEMLEAAQHQQCLDEEALREHEQREWLFWKAANELANAMLHETSTSTVHFMDFLEKDCPALYDRLYCHFVNEGK